MSKEPLAMPPERNSHQEAVRRSIGEGSAFNAAYAIMNALSAVVACYGLLEDSAAVVIGAMVIATLLGPILGIALGLVDGETALLRKALWAEVVGMGLVLAIAFVIGKIHESVPLTREIRSRTSPGVFDLMIALGGGAACAYATVNPRLSVGLVGVAIATALVPPLSACGICLARGDTRLAFGSFVLFGTNLVGIQLASSVVLWLHGYNKMLSRPLSGERVILRNAFSVGVALVLIIVFGLHGARALSQHLFEKAVRSRLEQLLRADPGSNLTQLHFQWQAEKTIVTADVETPAPIGPDKVAALEHDLPVPAGGKLELVVRSVLTQEANRNGYLHEMTHAPDGKSPEKPDP